ncbi:hypothetical protein N7457_000105 [Penicillium paradoxum]|uniref:uncharacterized protein n=1 Tax=Penicillium paradoxum TaxID=176176 RepID=UPI002546A4D1|nr:uncharacterized protein N7457_000105 [Penicillium paradoxum]KAJ5793506.1 hypothetical protein N7457_000105 [Penicillium paradoxum]
MKPDQSLLEISNGIEDSVRPQTPAPKVHLNKVIYLEVDIRIHMGGQIVDSAFTMAFDPVYSNLLECEIDGKTHPVKATRNLCGHTTLPYSIHGTKTVPLIKSDDMTKIEDGRRRGLAPCYARCMRIQRTWLYPLLNPFWGRLERTSAHPPSVEALRIGLDRKSISLVFVKSGILGDYPLLNEKQDTYTAQSEHLSGLEKTTHEYQDRTILPRPTVQEAISRGDDL